MFGRESVVQKSVVVPLIDDQDTVVFEHGVDLGQRLAPVQFGEKMGERVAQAYDRVVCAVYIAVEPAPVGLDNAQDVAVGPPVLECLGEHLRAAVRADYVETCLEQPHRVISGPGGDIQHLADAPDLQLIDEEGTLAARAAPPVDELIPLLDETGGVLRDVVIRFASSGGLVTDILL